MNLVPAAEFAVVEDGDVGPGGGGGDGGDGPHADLPAHRAVVAVRVLVVDVEADSVRPDADGAPHPEREP